MTFRIQHKMTGSSGPTPVVTTSDSLDLPDLSSANDSMDPPDDQSSDEEPSEPPLVVPPVTCGFHYIITSLFLSPLSQLL